MLDSLHRRPRGQRAARLLGWEPPAPRERGEADRGSPPASLAVEAAEVIVRRPAVAAGPVTALLRSRLSEQQLVVMRSRLGAEEAARLEAADARVRPELELAFCVAHLEDASRATGLLPDSPPQDVHVVESEANLVGGAYRYADLLIEALEDAGATVDDLRRALDFGASSGRVVRVLQAAYGEIEWYACDPLESAVDWGRAHLPGVHWLRSELDPPLAYPAAHFGLVCALSIWTHFAERPARQWFSEMHRVIAPGGRLVITVHGWHALRFLQRREDLWPPERLASVAATMHDTGFAFSPVFDPDTGDHGINSPEWGFAWVTPEWIRTHLARAWSVAAFLPGNVDDWQDIIVLERR